MKMKRRNHNILLLVIVILGTCAVGIVIAYAALSTSLETKFGNLTQQALTWNVGFSTGSVAGIASNSSVECKNATVTSSTVSGIKVIFQSPGDKCSYTFTVINNGTIGASITSITPKTPSSASCSTASGSTMICGNITYKLRYDSATSSTQPAIGDVLAAKSGSTATTRNIVLTAEYTGTTTASSETSDFKQSGFGFTINYGQH